MQNILYIRPSNDKTKINSTIWNKFEADFISESSKFNFVSNIFYYINNNSYISIIKNLIDIFKTAKKNNNDIVVFYGENKLAIFAGLAKLFRFTKCKIILLEFAFEGNLKLHKKYLYKIALSNYFFIGVCSDYEIERYSNELNINKKMFKNVPAPIEYDYYNNLLGCSDDVYILSAGKGYRDYGVLIKAASYMNDVKFVIISDFNSMKGLDVTSENIEILYNVDRDKYYELLGKAFMVVVPVIETNRSAGHQVIYQAMAMSKPVISTDTYTIREFVKNEYNGMLVGQGDVDSLVLSINKLIEDRDLYNRVSFNGSITAKNYNIEAYYSCLRSLIDV